MHLCIWNDGMNISPLQFSKLNIILIKIEKI